MSVLDEAQRYPLSAILCIAALATSLAEVSGRSIDHLVLYSAESVLSEPWRLITTNFPHGGMIHLIFNLLWIWQLGRALEARMGTGPTAVLAIVTAIAASGCELILQHTSIGLSGVVYGFAAYAWMRGRRDPRFRGIIDDSLRNFFVVIFFLCIFLTELGIMPIANAAHAGGAIMGLALGSGRPWLAPLIVTLMGTAVLLVSTLTGEPPESMAARWYNEGIGALERGDGERAVELFEQATERDPEFAEAWVNLSVARRETGDRQGATEAALEAVRIDPGSIEPPEVRARYLELLQRIEAERNATGQ